MPRETNITDLERARRLAEQARDVALPANIRALVENIAATIDAMVAEIEDLPGALHSTRASALAARFTMKTAAAARRHGRPSRSRLS